jgi:hypothetical protein
MDRVSGWYKRSTSWIIFWIGLAVSLALNVNTITVADYLYRNDSARQALVARAQTAVADTAFLQRSYQEARATLDSATLPLGWSKGWGAPRPLRERPRFEIWFDVVAPVLGIVLTAVAATFGAPFWFDLLNKVMVVRSTVKPHEKSGEESSEDRQAPKGKKAAPPPEEEAEPPAEGAEGPRAGAPRLVVAPLVSAAPSRPPSPRDKDSSVDGCDVEMAGVGIVTEDEDLPPSEGGVV